MSESWSSRLRVRPGKVDLSAYATDGTPGVPNSKSACEGALEALGPGLLELQTRLFAHGRSGELTSLLLVLQGMDTSGKGGGLVHTVGLVDPQGVKITSFKAPSAEELSHDFLWRIEKAVPPAGYLGVFDRSHYEDVLIGRVRKLASAQEIDDRYGEINDFEKRLVDGGTVIVKCMLHISPAEQKRRLLARLDDPTKYWKYDPGDVDERQLWADYARAYEIALERTSTAHAPWHVVPSDKKWYRNLAVAALLHEALAGLHLEWPRAAFDIGHEKQRLAEDTIS